MKSTKVNHLRREIIEFFSSPVNFWDEGLVAVVIVVAVSVHGLFVGGSVIELLG